MMRRRLSSQRGIGYLGALLLIAVIGFFATLAFKMAPAYFDYMQIRSVMDSLTERPDLALSAPNKIVEAAASQLRMNNIRSVNKKHFKLERVPNGVKMLVNYQVARHIAFNIDVLMSFDYSVVLDRS